MSTLRSEIHSPAPSMIQEPSGNFWLNDSMWLILVFNGMRSHVLGQRNNKRFSTQSRKKFISKKSVNHRHNVIHTFCSRTSFAILNCTLSLFQFLSYEVCTAKLDQQIGMTRSWFACMQKLVDHWYWFSFLGHNRNESVDHTCHKKPTSIRHETFDETGSVHATWDLCPSLKFSSSYEWCKRGNYPS